MSEVTSMHDRGTMYGIASNDMYQYNSDLRSSLMNSESMPNGLGFSQMDFLNQEASFIRKKSEMGKKTGERKLVINAS